MILIQSGALFVDAYRELNAKKLFWITMALNLLAVVVFGALGINETGPSFLHWTFDNQFFNTGNISPELFYKFHFVSWGIPVWLTWVATILALVSTAGLVPDLISSGTIETVLSKPIGRVRLLMTKFVFGLLFVAAQVIVFALGCFLVLWIRGGVVVPELFLAVPIVLAFFSYLFAVCLLLGLVTRSTIAALLLTILFWFLVFLVNIGDNMVVGQREGVIVRLEDARENLENQIALADRLIETREADGGVIEDAEGNAITDLEAKRAAVSSAYTRSQERVPELEEASETWTMWSSRVVWLKTLLPKTQETTALLDRFLISREELAQLLAEQSGVDPEAFEGAPAIADPRVAERIELAQRNRTMLWVLGTSFVFEGLVLALACLIFARRDF